MNNIVAPFVIELALISWRSIFGSAQAKAQNTVAGLPIPSVYLSAVLVYGVLSLAKGEAARPATLSAWGFTVATAVNMWDPSNPFHVAAPSANVFTAGTTPTPTPTPPGKTVPNKQGVSK